MFITVDIFLRVVAIVIFCAWWTYWRITEREADQKKPKKLQQISFFDWRRVTRWFIRIGNGVLLLQLFGLRLFEFPVHFFITQLIGFLLILVGVSISILARKALGTNWAHASEYQVKSRQELVTHSIYRYIRHPIYFGLIISFIGGQFLVQSYLVLLGFLFFVGAYKQAKLEEEILIAHFGNAYKKYQKHSKMFIPYLW